MSTLIDHLVAEILALEVQLFSCHERLRARSDDEALHDLRITVRRLRSVLRPLRGLPAVEQLEGAARAVGQVSTPLRDMEVLAAHLNERGFIEAAQARFAQLPAGYALLADSSELARLIEMFDAFPKFLRAAQHQGLLEHLEKHINKRLAKQWRRLEEAMADPGHDRHRLRLLIKRVRYGADAWPQFGALGKKTMPRLKAAQTALGDWHDHLQWLIQAERETDLHPLVAAWQTAMVRAEQRADAALERLHKSCG